VETAAYLPLKVETSVLYSKFAAQFSYVGQDSSPAADVHVGLFLLVCD
jgi:hypothetical protein